MEGRGVMMPQEPLIAGVELGGTKTVVVLSRGARIIDQRAFPTGAPKPTLDHIRAQLSEWTERERIAAFGIAAFGPVQLDPEGEGYGEVLSTPKPGWQGVNLLDELAAGLPCPVALDTDVNGAALAEWAWGAGKGLQSLCYITIGTGVGGGLIVNGAPVRGAMHPEIGHVRVPRVPHDDFAGTCTFHGDCIEGLICGPALAARFGMAGDRIGADHPLWANVASDLAHLVCSLLLTLSVQRILIGGGVGMGRTHLLPQVRQLVLERLAGYLPYVTEQTIGDIVTPPQLGVRAGPLGAVALALSTLDGGMAFQPE